MVYYSRRKSRRTNDTANANTVQMNPGAKLFVYTDGVAEATNAQNELFGMGRTVDALNQAADKSPEEVLQAVNSAVQSFVVPCLP